MIEKYYIQVGNQSAKEIFDEFGIYVSETSGLNNLAESKGIFNDNTKLEQGDSASLPSVLRLSDKKIKITFKAVDLSGIESFLENIFSGTELSYFDTYRNTGFRGMYSANSYREERYRVNGDYLEFDMDFISPNGITYGFNNQGGSSVNIEVESGSADLFFSDGTSNLGVSGNLIKPLVDGFAIVSPSVYGGVIVTNG